MNYIEEYNNLIVNNDIVVSNKVKEVYKHLIKNMNNEFSEYYYDNAAALFAIEFIEKFCKHSKGKLGGKPFILELWQKAIISALFGFKNKKTGKRQYRELILMVARKNGKSVLASAIGLYMLFADGEAGAEVYSCATKKDQSKIIWNEAKAMIKKSKALSKYSKTLVSEIKCIYNEGIFRPLSSDSNSLDGLNVHCSLIDELHAIKDKNLYDVIVDGMTAREQPLSIITTTAGTVRENIFDIKYKECEMIINGYTDNSYIDEKTLPIIYELDSRHEWTNEKNWYKANPALGTIKSIEQLRDKVEKAKKNDLLVKNLLTKDFNIRETSVESFLNFETLNNEATFDINELRGSYAIAGVDLSQTIDLTCATLLIRKSATDKTIYCIQKYFMPADLLEERSKIDNVPYSIWQNRGLIDACEGKRIDYHLITAWLKEIQDKYDIYIYKVGFDRWSAAYWVDEMKQTFGNTTMVDVAQGKQTLSNPMRCLKTELESKNINYNNNPVLKWCMSNVTVDRDKNDNIQPNKAKSKNRIDGFAALLDAYVVYQNDLENYIALLPE